MTDIEALIDRLREYHSETWGPHCTDGGSHLCPAHEAEVALREQQEAIDGYRRWNEGCQHLMDEQDEEIDRQSKLILGLRRELAGQVLGLD